MTNKFKTSLDDQRKIANDVCSSVKENDSGDTLDIKNLNACLEALLCNKEINKYNNIKVLYDNEQTNLYNAKLAKQRKARSDYATEWDKKRKSKYNEYINEKKFSNCGLWTHIHWNNSYCTDNPSIGPGWKYTGRYGRGCTVGQGAVQCQRTTDKANQDADIWMKNHSNLKSIDQFNKDNPDPNINQYSKATKLDPADIKCCSNITTQINSVGDINATQECSITNMENIIQQKKDDDKKKQERAEQLALQRKQEQEQAKQLAQQQEQEQVEQLALEKKKQEQEQEQQEQEQEQIGKKEQEKTQQLIIFGGIFSSSSLLIISIILLISALKTK